MAIVVRRVHQGARDGIGDVIVRSTRMINGIAAAAGRAALQADQLRHEPGVIEEIGRTGVEQRPLVLSPAIQEHRIQ
jgi:hypothetical protein